MLDPKEMKKGGFGAFAELDRERRAEREKASPNGGAPTSDPAPAAPETETTAIPTKPATP